MIEGCVLKMIWTCLCYVQCTCLHVCWTYYMHMNGLYHFPIVSLEMIGIIIGVSTGGFVLFTVVIFTIGMCPIGIQE